MNKMNLAKFSLLGVFGISMVLNLQAQNGLKTRAVKDQHIAAAKQNREDTAVAVDTTRATPTGYHYDFYDKELSTYAVAKLTKQAEKARVILAGENHRFVKFNSKSEYLWMKLLYENAGYRNYVIELSPTRALFFERYICKGDTLARNFVRATSSARYMRLFDSLAVWQQSLPEADRIHIYGLDVERFADMTVMWMNDVVSRRLATTPAPNTIATGVQAIKTLGSGYYYGGLKDYVESVENLEEDESEIVLSDSTATVAMDTAVVSEKVEPSKPMITVAKPGDWKRLDSELFSFDETPAIAELYKFLDSNSAEMKKWLGPLWEEYNQAFSHLREVHYWEERDNTAQQFQWREEEMYRRFTVLLDKYPNAKFFGQFGRCHVGLEKQQQDCGWFEYSSLANKLKTRYFKNDSSILNVGIFYWDHKDRTDDISSTDLLHNEEIQREVDDLYNATSGNTMLFDLVSDNKGFVELRKKFAFVVVTGSDYSEDGDDDDDGSEDDYSNERKKNAPKTNMGIQLGFYTGMPTLAGSGSAAMTDYLLTHESYTSAVVPNQAMFGLTAGYTSGMLSLLVSSGTTGKKLLKTESSLANAARINSWTNIHSAEIQWHTSNRINRKLLRGGVVVGVSNVIQGMEAQLFQDGSTSLTDNTVLKNNYWVANGGLMFGILKDNVGLDVELGYRYAPGNYNWKFATGNDFTYIGNGSSHILQESNLSNVYMKFNVRFIIPGTQPVTPGYLKYKNGEDAYESDYAYVVDSVAVGMVRKK